MKNNSYNSGELHVGKGSKNRYTSSSFVDDVKKSSIAVIASMLVLATITCVFFAVFGGFDTSTPAGNFPSSSTTTSTTTDNSKPTEPDTKYPYATITDKTNFIASKGGNDLSNVYLYSEYAILIRLSDMTTIAHQNADTKMYPASMTKVMTVVTALDLIEDLEDEYVFSPGVLEEIDEKSSNADMLYMYNTYGSTKYTVRDLLYGISYRSGADSVICLLDYLGMTIQEFASLMNEKAIEIGLQNTIFGGAIGMDSEENQTTCRDMAAIMAYAMENPLCKELFSGVSYRLTYIEMTYFNRTFYNTLYLEMDTSSEKVLGENYTFIATKSGYEVNPNHCLVSYIKNNHTGEYFVLVTAYANKSKYAPIYDMQILFEKFNP